MTATQVRRRYLVLLALRWLPSGLTMPVFVLLALDRGLTIGQLGAVAAVQGVTVFLLEVPTGGLADTFGRRPVLLVAAVVHTASLVLLSVASTVTMFVLVFLLQGVYRALDSGPLEAWYVDATLARDAQAPIERGLGAGGVVLGLAVAGGALTSGALVALDPVPGVAALTVPVLVATAGAAVRPLAIAALVHEDSREPPTGTGHRASTLRDTIHTAAGLVASSKALRLLVAVELFWGFGMVSFETLMPVRLAEVTESTQTAASMTGPLLAAAWVASAAGAGLVVPATRWFGVHTAAAALRVLQGFAVAIMAVSAGLVGVVVGFLACYTVHGTSNPVHMALLHRQVSGAQRTTVASLNSMVAQPSGAVGLVVLTWLASATSVQAAMLVGAGVLAAGAPLYLAARPRRPVPTPAMASAPTGQA